MTGEPTENAESERGPDQRRGVRWNFSVVLREATAVLLAILAAFGLDAYWSNRSEHVALDRRLQAVALELQTAAAQARQASNERALDRATAFLRLKVDDVGSLSPDSALVLASSVGRYTFNANTSTIRSVASSAVLGDRYPDLVPALLAIPNRIDDMAEEDERLQGWIRVCTERLMVLGVRHSLWAHGSQMADMASLDPRAVLRILVEDDQYPSCVAEHHRYLSAYAREVQSIGALIDEALKRLGEVR